MKESSGLIRSVTVSQGEEPLMKVAPLPQSGPYYGEPDADQGGYSRLHEYLRSVRKHFWMVLGTTLLITAISAIYMARQA